LADITRKFTFVSWACTDEKEPKSRQKQVILEAENNRWRIKSSQAVLLMSGHLATPDLVYLGSLRAVSLLDGWRAMS
jgi:hypothetical protein